MTESSDRPHSPPATGAPERSLLSRLLNPHGWGPRRLVLQLLLCTAIALLITDRLAHQLFWPEPGSTEVLLVSSPTCPHSRAVESHLRANAIPFRKIDSREDVIASGLAGWAFQTVRVPILVVGTEIIHGNRTEQIDQAIAALGYETVRP